MKDDMKDEMIIRHEILVKVKDLYKLREEKKIFIPGETKVNYAGHVFAKRVKQMEMVPVDIGLIINMKVYQRVMITNIHLVI